MVVLCITESGFPLMSELTSSAYWREGVDIALRKVFATLFTHNGLRCRNAKMLVGYCAGRAPSLIRDDARIACEPFMPPCAAPKHQTCAIDVSCRKTLTTALDRNIFGGLYGGLFVLRQQRKPVLTDKGELVVEHCVLS